MRGVRPIPARLLPDACLVRPPLEGGGFGQAREIGRVRFERAQSMSSEAHRTADAGSGTLFVDAANSRGAFEIEAGSRVEVGGNDYLAARVARFEGARGRVHHWEVDLR